MFADEIEIIRELIQKARLKRERKDVDELSVRMREPTAVNLHNQGVGPRESIKRLRLNELTAQGKAQWLETAFQNAVLGSCRKTLPSVRSGILCYLAFARRLHLFVLHKAFFVVPRISHIFGWRKID